MVSAGLTWHGVTKPLFVNEEGIKVNGPRYLAHLQGELLPAIREVYPRENFIFVQDSAPAHASNVKNYMKAELGKRFIAPTDWPSYSPDCNPPWLLFLEWCKYKGLWRKALSAICHSWRDEDEDRGGLESMRQQPNNIRKFIRQFVPRFGINRLIFPKIQGT